MTQVQIAHQVSLPPCSGGHAARHIHDRRGVQAGGGHFIECSCRCTAKHAGVGLALDEWFRFNNKRRPRAPRIEARPPGPPAVNLLQFPLPLQGGRRHG